MISKLPAVFTLIHLMMVEILQINNLNSVSNCNYEDTSTRPNQMWWRPHTSCVVEQNMRWHVRSCLETTKPQQADTMVDHKQGFVPLSRVLVQIKYFDRAPPRPRPSTSYANILDCFIFLSIVENTVTCANSVTYSNFM